MYFLSNRLTNLLGILLLTILFLTALASMRGDSLTFDELAHIPAGYSYLTQKDYRLNPEHPPLVKDLAALPLLFLNLHFPAQSQNWKQDAGAPPWWVQFDFGNEFLYASQNNPLAIIFWARYPMIILLIVLGWFLFRWARELGGNEMGLGVLALFVFSPTFLAHGRLVTTDVAAALGTVIAIYYWLKFLKSPTIGSVGKAGFALGAAMLMKFTILIVIPFLGVISIFYALLSPSNEKLKTLTKYILLSFLVGSIGFLFLIWPLYYFHTLNYPHERQLRDTIADLSPEGIKPYEKILAIDPIDNPLLRPLAQYFRGALMALQRSSFGNTVYFLGEISASGSWYYFPVMYLLKEPLPLHILTILGFIGVFFAIKKRFDGRILQGAMSWIKENFTVFTLLLFVFLYWMSAIAGNLNIGIRHMLPTFPLLSIVSLWGIKKLLEYSNSQGTNLAIRVVLSLLFVWYIGSSLSAFPHYISYYNEVAGGIKNGYKVAVDSNYDWGQDFYRLLKFIEENKIEKIYLDYFGGEDPEFWLGDAYVRLDPREVSNYLSQGLPLSEAGAGIEGWVAVSLNHLMGGIAKPAKGFDQPTGYYQWILQYEPVARAGNSILIYKIEKSPSR